MPERSLDKSDQRLLRLMTKRVRVAIRGQRDTGLSGAIRELGQDILWELRLRASGSGRPCCLSSQSSFRPKARQELLVHNRYAQLCRNNNGPGVLVAGSWDASARSPEDTGQASRSRMS
jgi:hypothetical protein